MIYLIGDTHGDIKQIEHSVAKKGIKDGDILIVLGDFGFTWSYTTMDSFLNWSECNMGITVLFVDGNHENFETLSMFPIIRKYNGNVRVLNGSTFHLMRGECYNINGTTFFCMGGATSVDKMYRIENVSWWKEEIPSLKEFQHGIDKLEDIGNTVDYILTHTCPNTIVDLLVDMVFMVNCPVGRYLDVINDTVKFKHWYFGHFHEDITINDKYTCVYDEVIEI